jgi:RNase_H superfamily
VSLDKILSIATGGQREIQDDWMPATAIRPLLFDDPGTIWLDYYGEKNGFKPDSSPYAFLTFISKKGHQFEDKWKVEMANSAVTVCTEDYEVRSFEKVLETLRLIHTGTPIIAKPALWLAAERVYGVPDLIVHTSWLKGAFPQLVPGLENESHAPNLEETRKPGHYVVFDVKFTTGLDEADKKKDLLNYAAQIRIYSFALGTIQGVMPQHAYLIARDRIDSPLLVKILSQCDKPIDFDLASLRDHFIDIKLKGERYRPWIDDIVISNLSIQDEKGATAKSLIAEEKYPGRDPVLLHQVSLSIRKELKALGFTSLDSLLAIDPIAIPFEKIKGLGPKKSKLMRAILEANRSANPIKPNRNLLPAQVRHEFFVDFEYFTNVNVDFGKQWPGLEGHEMVFMVGVGKRTNGNWNFTSFVAKAENQEEERAMFTAFVEHLNNETNGNATNRAETALFHWTGAEVWQSKRSSDRLNFPADHPLRNLPWLDLQKPFTEGPAAIPGAWGYGLKEIANALGHVDPALAVQWPESLCEGLAAMVMGWHAYASGGPLNCKEMKILNKYLEIDCAALSAILQWLRR